MFITSPRSNRNQQTGQVNSPYSTLMAGASTACAAAAGWSPRPGNTCDAIDDTIVCFGGYGQSPLPWDVFGRVSPTDLQISRDGATWAQVPGAPWNAANPDAIRYDYDTVVAPDGDGRDAIYTFGGDRETFNFFDPTQWLKVDDDVWRFAPGS